MNIHKKFYIVPATVVVLSIAGIVLVQPRGTKPSPVKSIGTSSVATTRSDAADLPVAQPTPNATSAPTSSPTAPTPAPAAPAYGELPDHPGIYAVSDKQAVMDAAGVPADQQAAALAVVNKIRGDQWIYKMSDDTNVFWDDLFKMSPPKPQDPSVALPSITDYRDSPVEQLRLANYLANEKYTGWGNVLEIINNGGNFTR